MRKISYQTISLLPLDRSKDPNFPFHKNFFDKIERNSPVRTARNNF